MVPWVDCEAKLKLIGVESLADMTFATTYVPGAADTKAFDEEVVKPVLGDAPNPRKRIGLHRTH